MLDLVLKNANVFVGDSFSKVSVGVKDGKIVTICEDAYMPAAKEVMDLTGQYLIPGTIDTHMHVRDPGHVRCSRRCNNYYGTSYQCSSSV